MMYNVGDKIILREDLEHLEIVERGIYYTDKMDYMKRYFRKIERAGENSYKVDGFYVVDDMIDHERVEQLRDLEEYISDEQSNTSKPNSTPIKSITYHGGESKPSSQYEAEETVMMYDIGDEIVLRRDLRDGVRYGGWRYLKERLGEPGGIATVTSVRPGPGVYYVGYEERAVVSDDMIDHKATDTLNGVEEIKKDLQSENSSLNDTDEVDERYSVSGEELQHGVGEWLVLKDGRKVRITDIVSGFWGGKLYKCTHDYDGNFPIGACDIDEEETALMQGGFIKLADEVASTKSTIDIYESAYQSRPFNEYRAIMEFTAERYIRSGGADNLDKAIRVLRKLKEKELERSGY